MPVVAGSLLQTFDDEDVTVDDTAGGVRLTHATYFPASGSPAKAATLVVETAQLRWTKANGASLTASAGGAIANVGTVLFLDQLNDILNFRAIRTGASSGTLHAQYHR